MKEAHRKAIDASLHSKKTPGRLHMSAKAVRAKYGVNRSDVEPWEYSRVGRAKKRNAVKRKASKARRSKKRRKSK